MDKVMNKYPSTIDEAVDSLLLSLPEKQKEEIKNTTEEKLFMLHFDLGMGIRNEFGLWADNKELLKSCGSDEIHPDDASMVIIKALWDKLREK